MLILFIHLAWTDRQVVAQKADQDLLISYEDNLLSIAVKDVDIKQVLFIFSEKTGIDFTYPVSLAKNVTLSRSGVSLKAGLKSLLKGLNHAIVYSVSKEKKTEISKVLIYSKSQARPLSAAQRRNMSRIQAYERQLEALRIQLSSVDADSAQGKQYARRMMLLERNLKRLEDQLD